VELQKLFVQNNPELDHAMMKEVDLSKQLGRSSQQVQRSYLYYLDKPN
jgi:hypothetical protein